MIGRDMRSTGFEPVFSAWRAIERTSKTEVYDTAKTFIESQTQLSQMYRDNLVYCVRKFLSEYDLTPNNIDKFIGKISNPNSHNYAVSSMVWLCRALGLPKPKMQRHNVSPRELI